MRTVLSDNEELRAWFKERDPYVMPHYVIGLTEDKTILAVVAYSHLMPHSVQIHAQAEVGDWITKEMLQAMFEYPFITLDKRTLIAPVLANNHKINRLVKHLQFSQCGLIPDATVEGDAVFYMMKREKCPWLNLKNREKERWVA